MGLRHFHCTITSNKDRSKSLKTEPTTCSERNWKGLNFLKNCLVKKKNMIFLCLSVWRVILSLCNIVLTVLKVTKLQNKLKNRQSCDILWKCCQSWEVISRCLSCEFFTNEPPTCFDCFYFRGMWVLFLHLWIACCLCGTSGVMHVHGV